MSDGSYLAAHAWEWIDDAPRVSAAVLAELRAWAGAEDAAESERKSVRELGLGAPRLDLGAPRLEEGVRAESNVCMHVLGFPTQSEEDMCRGWLRRNTAMLGLGAPRLDLSGRWQPAGQMRDGGGESA